MLQVLFRSLSRTEHTRTCFDIASIDIPARSAAQA